MPKTPKTPPPRNFQDLILALQRYWAAEGCVLLQPYDIEVGAKFQAIMRKTLAKAKSENAARTKRQQSLIHLVADTLRVKFGMQKNHQAVGGVGEKFC